jgi:hypothetical protein
MIFYICQWVYVFGLNCLLFEVVNFCETSYVRTSLIYPDVLPTTSCLSPRSLDSYWLRYSDHFFFFFLLGDIHYKIFNHVIFNISNLVLLIYIYMEIVFIQTSFFIYIYIFPKSQRIMHQTF